MNNTLSKEDTSKLIEAVKFLSNLKMGELDFYCLKKGKEFITFKDKNGKEVEIKFTDIKIKPEPVVAVLDITNSDSTLAGLSDIQNRQNGGGMLSDSSSIVHRTFIKSSNKLKKKNKEDFSSTSSAMIGGYNDNSATSSVMPNFNMMKGGNIINNTNNTNNINNTNNNNANNNRSNSDVYSATSVIDFTTKQSQQQIPQQQTPIQQTTVQVPVQQQIKQVQEQAQQTQTQVKKIEQVQQNQEGGGFSDTSSYNPRMLKNAIFSDASVNFMVGGGCPCSETSSIDPRAFGRGGGALSDTSSVNPKMVGMVGGGFSETSSVNPGMVGMVGGGFSETSSVNPGMVGMIGGGDTDTIGSISELKNRKNKKNNLDLNIFGKQNGGGSDAKLKLRNMGIHSSSTDSLCE